MVHLGIAALVGLLACLLSSDTGVGLRFNANVILLWTHTQKTAQANPLPPPFITAYLEGLMADSGRGHVPGTAMGATGVMYRLLLRNRPVEKNGGAR